MGDADILQFSEIKRDVCLYCWFFYSSLCINLRTHALSCYDTVCLFRFSLHTEVIVVTFLMWRLLTTLWVVETRSPSNKSAL